MELAEFRAALADDAADGRLNCQRVNSALVALIDAVAPAEDTTENAAESGQKNTKGGTK